MQEHPIVAIVVLHWNNYADTHDCLTSLRQVDYQRLEIIVVDNASTNDSVSTLRRTFPDVHFIVNPQNFGFAVANNVGIRFAQQLGAEFILLLNNDTIVDPNFIVFLIDAAKSHPDAVVLSPAIYVFDRQSGPTRRAFYTGGHVSLLRGAGVVETSGVEIDNGAQSRTAVEVSYVTGCCMFMTSRALDEIGFLDESFFFGVEDVDYSLRVVKAGYHMLFIPKAVIWHKVASSRSFSQDEFYNGYISKFYLMRKHLPLIAWWFWYTMFAIRSLLLSHRISSQLVRLYDLPESFQPQISQAMSAALRAALTGNFASPLRPRQR